MPPEKFLSGGGLSADGRQQLTKLLRGYLNASVVDVFTLLPADLPDKKVIFLLLTIDIISRYLLSRSANRKTKYFWLENVRTIVVKGVIFSFHLHNESAINSCIA